MNTKFKINLNSKLIKYISILGLILICIATILNNINNKQTINTDNINFYKSKEAAFIGDNMIFAQNLDGGWNKRIYNKSLFKFFDILHFKYKKLFLTSSIDNDATVTEIEYLSKLYTETKITKYKKSAMKGIRYLLKIQYPNGGFPQRASKASLEYQYQITFNDRAMINVLQLFKDIIDKKEQYSYIDPHTYEKIITSYNKGIDCILKTQMTSGMWAAQYDRKKLTPCYGRTYEPPAIDTRESADIVLFLMKIDNPSNEIKNSIEKAVNWYNENAIKNKELKTCNQNKYSVLKLVNCSACKPIWARFYDINKNIPIFSDRSKVIKYNISEINQERMFSYDWYISSGNIVLDNYKNWKTKN